MDQSNDYYSIPEAAKRFGVNRATMWKWVKSEKVKAIVTPGGHHRITHREIDRLLGQGRASTKASQGKTILVVDDDKIVRTTLKRYLVREKFRVETAPDGFVAGMKVQALKPDLVILDIMMAGMDGFEVCRTIKADDFLKNTRVIIMTGFDTPENRARALREGADAYLPKSGDFKQVINQIRDLLTKT